jgi:PAS domain S-box-containing protein
MKETHRPSAASPEQSSSPNDPPPPNPGAAREQALHRYEVLDTPPEQAFDRITRLAASLFDTPVAAINFVASDRQWLKSTVGLEPGETGLDISFCVHTLKADAVTVIEDATQDDRVADNPLVTSDPALCFYAGAPLITPDGVRIGTLCVMDTCPRSFPEDMYAQLDDLAAMVMDELELRREVQARKTAEAEIRRQDRRYRTALNNSPVMFARCDRNLRYEWILNPHPDFDRSSLLGRRDTEVDDGPGTQALMTLKQRALDTKAQLRQEITFDRSDGLRTYDITATPHLTEEGTPQGVITAALDITDGKESANRLRLQSDVLEHITRGDSLDTILRNLIQSVETQRPGMTGSILFYDAESNSIRHGIAPNLPDAYNDAIDGVEVGPEAGSCGTAMHLQTTVIAEDIQTDPRWADYRDAALQHGLRACWSMPIIGEDDAVLGSFALYYSEPAVPTEADRAIIETARTLARIAIERRRGAKALQQERDLLAKVFNTSAAGILVLDAEGRFVRANARTEEMLDLDTTAVEGRSYNRPEWRITDAEGTVLSEDEHAFEQVIATGAPVFNLHHAIEWPNGRRRVFSINGAPLRDETGSLRWIVFVLEDITERTAAKRALEQREMQLRSINENVSDGIYRSTRGEGIVYANQALADMFGYPSADALRQVDPADLYATEGMRETMFTLADHQGNLDGAEVEFRRRDGSTFIGLMTSTVLRDDDGTPKHRVGAITDITKRKEVEQRLREKTEALEQERQRLEMALEGADLGLWDVDLESGAAIYDERWAGMLGYSMDEIDETQAFFESLVHPDDLPRVKAVLASHAQGETDLMTLDLRMKARDGSWRWIHDRGKIMERNDDGSPRRLMGTHQDMTDTVRRRQALEKREAQIRGLANSVPGIIFRFYARPTGSDAWNYGLYFVSDQARSVLGLEPEAEGFFERFLAQVPASYRERLQTSVREAVINCDTWHFEMPFRRPTGGTIWVQGISTPIEHPDEIVFNGVLLDISHRKQLEDQLRRAQKMETVGTLAGGIAHDFNNILHATQAYLHMLENDLSGGTRTQSLVERALLGLERAGSLVDKLLTFSRQEGKTTETRVDVAEVVEETVALARPSVPSLVQVRTHTPPGCTVLGDPGQLQQVVMNLVTNAAQAMADGNDGDGVLDVDVRRMRVDHDLARQYLDLEPGRYVRLSVSDSGPGMNEQTKDRIFEPFFTTKEVGEGTGLGLSVVHGIVQSHDGSISVFSEAGEGTTFHIYLPAASGLTSEDRSAETTRGEPSAPAFAAPSTHVLLVDDDEQVRDLESVRLSDMGYAVTTAAGGPAALDRIEARPNAYDLVLTDYLMPDMSGLQLVRQLRDAGYNQPVIVMSGFSARVTEADVRAAGAADFLHKPVGRSELDAALGRALQQDPDELQ